MYMDIGALVHHADLHFTGNAHRAEAGLPIGNGRMGSMVWTSPNALKMQVNRTDVLASGPDTDAFPEEHRDYGYACAFFDLDFVGFGPDVFDETTRESLNVYEAVAHIASHGVSIEGYAEDGDVLAFRVKDERELPTECAAKLKLLRPAEVLTRKTHSACSTLERSGDAILLRQEFREKAYYCASSVALRVVGRPAISRISDENNGTRRIIQKDMIGFGASNEYEMRLCMPAERGSYTFYIASAASFDPDVDVNKEAMEKLDAATRRGYEALLAEHSARWRKFWQKSYIHLEGFDESELLETHYQYYLYIMNSCSRNTQIAPNFGGLLFSPRGDLRHWGAMQWWNNLTLTYNAILPSGHTELMDPFLDMYSNMREKLIRAAQQEFGANGIYLFETTHVLGPAEIPQSLEEEFSNFMLDRGPATFKECSEAFRRYAEGRTTHETRWDFMNPSLVDSGRPFAWVTHMFASGAFLAYDYYLRYAYTRDMDYLREKGYPMIRGVAEFFRTYPRVTAEEDLHYPGVADGRVHIYGTTDLESNWGGYDPCQSLLAMHGIFRVAIQCARLLNTDEDMVEKWQEMLDTLTPIPTNKRADLAAELRKTSDDPEYWVTVCGEGWPHSCYSYEASPLIYMDMCNSETQYVDPDTYRIGYNTYCRFNEKSSDDIGCSEMDPHARMWAGMGDFDRLIKTLSGQLRSICAPKEHCWYTVNGSDTPYRNRLTAREGVNAISAQRLGNAAAGLQMGLMRCTGGAPAAPGVILVFPAWDKAKSAQFELWARDGFKVGAACRDGKITDLEITSTLGGECRLRNPFGCPVRLACGDRRMETDEDLIRWETRIGDIWRVEAL